jgi:cell division protein FtsB
VSARVVGGVLGLFLFTGLGVYGWQGVVRLRHVHEQLDTLQRDNAILRQQAEQLTQVIERLHHDPAYQEKIAREEQGMVREGEVMLKFPSKDKAGQ